MSKPHAADTPRIVVPTSMLADELEKHIPRLNRENTPLGGHYTGSGMELGYNMGGSSPDTGWKTLLTMRVMRHMPWISTEDGVYRRLYSIEKREFPTTGVLIADAILLGCGVNIEDTIIPTLPRGIKAAQLMVDEWCAVWKPRMALPKKRKLARDMDEFARAFIAAVHEDNSHAEALMVAAPEPLRLVA